MSYVAVFILSTSQEIIGSVIDETDTHYVIDRPLWIRIVDVAPNQVGPAFYPLSPVCPDSAIEINKANVMGRIKNVPSHLESEYVRNTSGIEIATTIPGWN